MKDDPVVATRPHFAWVLVALVGIAAASDAVAQWKWRDSTGRVTVSDTPPPRDVAEKDILQRPSPVAARRAAAASAPQAFASAVAAAPPNPLETEVEARKRKAEEEQKVKKKAFEESNAHARAENCTRARSQLRSLEDGMRLARVNEKGEREILDDKGRAAEIQRARQIIASDCGSQRPPP
jgi:Domain of unknown function (DUF4124)